MKGDFIFTSESVTEGHPDKLCDRISDAVVDHFLAEDPFSRVHAECAVATGIVFIMARFASEAVIDLPGVAREAIAGVGYAGSGFDPKTCSIMTSLDELPLRERADRDESELDEGDIDRVVACNQATVFGYACRQSPGLLPLPIWLAHSLARRLDAARRSGELPYLAPDGKTQVAVEYRDGRPARIHSLTVIAAVNGGSAPEAKAFRDDLMDGVVGPAFANEPIRPDATSRIFINPGEVYRVGGPALHSGLTGRKQGVDTYGEYARQNDSALSGKDPMRIERIGAYAARYAARTVVAADLADECEVQLSYAIGLSQPASMNVETFGTSRISEDEIASRLRRAFDFRPAGIVRAFDLRHRSAATPGGFYTKLSAYGHVGRVDLDLPWENPDRVNTLRG